MKPPAKTAHCCVSDKIIMKRPGNNIFKYPVYFYKYKYCKKNYRKQ